MASRIIRRKKKASNCPFCKSGKEPSYKDYESLKKFLTDRSKIIGEDRSGLCAKHQRRLSIAVKRARHLGLLPFVIRA
ncbi:MAG: 30S ribosomal protein S18 [Patescibacteria group bacterium]